MNKKPKLDFSGMILPGAKLYVNDGNGNLRLHPDNKFTVELTAREIELALIGLTYADDTLKANKRALNDGEERDAINQKRNEIDQLGQKLCQVIFMPGRAAHLGDDLDF